MLPKCLRYSDFLKYKVELFTCTLFDDVGFEQQFKTKIEEEERKMTKKTRKKNEITFFFRKSSSLRCDQVAAVFGSLLNIQVGNRCLIYIDEHHRVTPPPPPPNVWSNVGGEVYLFPLFSSLFLCWCVCVYKCVSVCFFKWNENGKIKKLRKKRR